MTTAQARHLFRARPMSLSHRLDHGALFPCDLCLEEAYQAMEAHYRQPCPTCHGTQVTPDGATCMDCLDF